MGPVFSYNNNPASQTVGPATGRTNESVGGLKISESAACPSTGLFPCSIIVDGTITSSSVTLSRDILGKLEVPDEGGAPSDEWEWDPSFDMKDGKPVWSGWARTNWSGGRHYKIANPAKFGRDGYDSEGKRWANYHSDGRTDASQWAKEDIQDWTDDQKKYEKSKVGDATKQVYIWNPSDDGIVELNRETYGALTKLFLKPTLPFKVSFRDGLGKTQEVPQVTLISVFHPCPIRVESIQYDAVIQIGDFRGLSGTECTQEQDTSERAKRALAKQTIVLERRIAKAQEQVFAEMKKGLTSASYITAQSTLNSLIAKKDALALPKKRVCEPRDGAADKLVIFVPLKINDRPKPGAQYEQTRFVNTFANKIPSILGAQPDRYLGYPDVPAATQNDWKLSSILDPTDCYYTWEVTLTGQSQPVTVVFMKNPIAILSSDMGSIKRLPITPPSHVFHSNPTNVRFKSCPPRDISGVPVPCLAAAPPQKVPGPLAQAETEKNNKPAVSGTDWLIGLFATIGYLLLMLLAVWLAVKFANGPGGTALKGFGNYFGRTLAGASSSSSSSSASSSSSSSAAAAPKPEPEPKPKPTGLVLRTPAPKNNPVVLAPNLLGESREEFTARRRRPANPAGTGLA